MKKAKYWLIKLIKLTYVPVPTSVKEITRKQYARVNNRTRTTCKTMEEQIEEGASVSVIINN